MAFEVFGDSYHQFIPHLTNDLTLLGPINTAFYSDTTTLVTDYAKETYEMTL